VKKQVSVAIAATLFAATPALAAEPPTPYNTGFDPSSEVAPGVNGNMSSPVSSKFNLSIGGYLKLDAAYNSNNFGSNGYQSPDQQPPKSSVSGSQDQTIFSVRTSRIWFKSTGPSMLSAKTGGLIELDFANGSSSGLTPRLRHAYGFLDWGKTKLTFGQTWDNFSIVNANTIDFNGGLATGFGLACRVPQIKLSHGVDINAKNSFQFVVALQQPSQTNFNSNGTGDSWGAMPNIVGQAFFSSNILGTSPTAGGTDQQAFTTGFFGSYGNQHVSGQTNDKTVDSWGAGFYIFVPIIASVDGKKRGNTLTFEAQAFMAANLPPYTAAQHTGAAGNLQPAKGFAAAAYLQYFATDQLSFNIAYGRRQAINYDSYKSITDYERYNESSIFNVFYDLNAAIRVGAEYEHLKTRYGSITPGTSATGQSNIVRLAFYYYL